MLLCLVQVLRLQRVPAREVYSTCRPLFSTHADDHARATGTSPWPQHPCLQDDKTITRATAATAASRGQRAWGEPSRRTMLRHHTATREPERPTRCLKP